jgi:hypothetical protein
LLYEFTVDDPTTWTKPWTAQVLMVKADGLIYEYACHEGNYGMFGILSGRGRLIRRPPRRVRRSSDWHAFLVGGLVD